MQTVVHISTKAQKDFTKLPHYIQIKLQAWAKNVGWRLDYQVISPGLESKVLAASIYKDERFSDHAPLIMDYDYKLPAGSS